MDDKKLQPVIREIRRLNGRRYAEAAYFFVLEALDFTLFRRRSLGSDLDSQHLSGQELLAGIRTYAQEEFGPLAPYAFHSWGVYRTDDFGTLVFQMCDGGLLNAKESDRPEDFADGFDFEEAFTELDRPRSG